MDKVLPEIRITHCLSSSHNHLIITTERLAFIIKFTAQDLKTIGLEDCKQTCLLKDKLVTLSTNGVVYFQEEETLINGIMFIYCIGDVLVTSSQSGLLSLYSSDMKLLSSIRLNGFIISMTNHDNKFIACDCHGQVSLWERIENQLQNQDVLLEADGIPTVCPIFSKDGTCIAFAKTDRIYTINLSTRQKLFLQVDPCLVTGIIWASRDMLRVYTLSSNLYIISISTTMVLEKDLSTSFSQFLDKTWRSQYPSEPRFSTFSVCTTAHGLYDFVVFGAGPRSSMPHKIHSAVKNLFTVYPTATRLPSIEYVKNDLEEIDLHVNTSYLFWDLLKDRSDAELLTFVEEAVNILESSLAMSPQSDSAPQVNESIRNRGWMIYLLQVSRHIWSGLSEYVEKYEAVMNEKRVAIFAIVIDFVLKYVVDTGADEWSNYDLRVLKHFVEISDNQELSQAVAEKLGRKLEIISTANNCKACGDEIRFEGLWASACGNGHVWSKLRFTIGRCSLTCMILDTTEVVNCATCDLKMDNFEKRDGKIVDILKKFSGCLYCGSSVEIIAEDDI